MLSPISGFCSLHLPQVLRKENLFSLKNCTEIWDNSWDAAKAGDEATSIPPLQRGPGSRYLRPFSPHLQPLLNTFVPRRGTKPFRPELPLEEENPISQSLLPPQEPTLHPTTPSLAVLHSQGSKKAPELPNKARGDGFSHPSISTLEISPSSLWMSKLVKYMGGSQKTLGISQIWGAAFPPRISQTPLPPPGCSQSC